LVTAGAGQQQQLQSDNYEPYGQTQEHLNSDRQLAIQHQHNQTLSAVGGVHPAQRPAFQPHLQQPRSITAGADFSANMLAASCAPPGVFPSVNMLSSGMQSVMLNDSTVQSLHHSQKHQPILLQQQQQQVSGGSKVFVGGLSWETSDAKLRQYFENYGEVLEAFVSYDKNTGRPRGFGFVVFASPSVADKVVSLQHTIDRREVCLRTFCFFLHSLRIP
jgi:hypothetical protein